MRSTAQSHTGAEHQCCWSASAAECAPGCQAAQQRRPSAAQLSQPGAAVGAPLPPRAPRHPSRLPRSRSGPAQRGRGMRGGLVGSLCVGPNAAIITPFRRCTPACSPALPPAAPGGRHSAPQLGVHAPLPSPLPASPTCTGGAAESRRIVSLLHVSDAAHRNPVRAPSAALATAECACMCVRPLQVQGPEQSCCPPRTCPPVPAWPPPAPGTAPSRGSASAGTAAR